MRELDGSLRHTLSNYAVNKSYVVYTHVTIELNANFQGLEYAIPLKTKMRSINHKGKNLLELANVSGRSHVEMKPLCYLMNGKMFRMIHE